MLTTVPYSDAAGIHNIEWDAVSSVACLLTFHTGSLLSHLELFGPTILEISIPWKRPPGSLYDSPNPAKNEAVSWTLPKSNDT